MHPLDVRAFRRDLCAPDQRRPGTSSSRPKGCWAPYTPARPWPSAATCRARSIGVSWRMSPRRYRLSSPGCVTSASAPTTSGPRVAMPYCFSSGTSAHVLAPPAESLDLAATTAQAYVTGRALGRRFWVLEMRPEGLPLTPTPRARTVRAIDGRRHVKETATPADYSMWIVECGRALRFPVSGIYYGSHNAGQMDVSFCYAVITAGGTSSWSTRGTNTGPTGVRSPTVSR